MDALIAEKVMGESLTVPRERAMAIVGAHYVRSTGPTFKLDVHGYDLSVEMPDGDTLPSHPSDDNWNQRYFRHAVAELLAYPNEIAGIVERDIQACRLTPKPYSTDIAAAWEVVQRMQAREYEVVVVCPVAGVPTCEIAQLSWGGSEVEQASTVPLAICLAALRALDA